MALLIRPARKADADMAVEILRNSISELCQEDHQNDPAKIAFWLENKTVATWWLWVENLDASVCIAEEDGMVRGGGWHGAAEW